MNLLIRQVNKVPLFEDLERVKLRFIITCERLVEKQELSEENFNKIIEILNNLDNYTEKELEQELHVLTDGKLDLLFWKEDIFPGK